MPDDTAVLPPAGATQQPVEQRQEQPPAQTTEPQTTQQTQPEAQQTKTEEQRLYANKFKTVDDLEKAYAEAQKLIGKQSEEVSKARQGFIPEQGQEQARAAEVPDISDINGMISAAGLDGEDVAKHLTENKSLSEKHIEALKAKFGLPEGVLNQAAMGMLAMQQAKLQEIDSAKQAAAKIVGGEERLDSLLKWASTTYTPEQIKTMNDIIKNDPSQMVTVADAIAARYAREGQTTGEDAASTGRAQTAPAVAPFESSLAVGRAMKDPRYGKTNQYGQVNPNYDEAYTREVEARAVARRKALETRR